MLKKLMNILMLTCRKSTELISVKSYRTLTSAEKLQLKMHLLSCSACKKFKNQSELIDQAIDNLGSGDYGNQTLPEDRKETIQKHIHSH